MTTQERRLTLNERRYLAGRVAQDGIEFPVDLVEGPHDIPMVFTGEEVLTILESADRRAAEILGARPARIVVDIPPAPAPTWKRSWRDILGWAGIGAGAVLLLEIVAVVIYAVTAVG